MKNNAVRTIITRDIYPKEAEELFHKVLVYFNTNENLDKTFKMPIQNSDFFKEFVTLVAKRKCGLTVEMVNWSKNRVRVTISNPFEFDEYVK